MHLRGDSRTVTAFDELVHTVAADIIRYAREFGVRSIGATGVREGVALVDTDGRLRWAMGNVDFDSCHRPASGPPTRPLTLQGYLLSVLGAMPTRSTSEVAGHADEIAGLASMTDLRPDDALPPGTVIGTLASGTKLFLTGHDEHLANYGYRHLAPADLALHMGTYWNLMAPPSLDGGANCTSIRSVRASTPLPGYRVMVGYRWGKILSHVDDLASLPKASLQQRPGWAAHDRFVDSVARTSEIRAHVSLARQHLRAAARCLLSQVGDHGPTVKVVCAGGGTHLPTQLLTEVLPSEWQVTFGPADPTALGVAMLGPV
jgi:hypothetical protein